MNHRTIQTWLGVILFAAASDAAAESFVWKVTRGDDHLYLAGTIHVLSPSDYPLPAVFDQAYAGAEDIVLEADLNDLQTPEFQQELMQAMMYPPGQSLDGELSPEVLRDVIEFFAPRGLLREHVVAMRPPLIAITITMMELQRLGLAGTGVDEFYLNKAKQDEKDIAGLETAAEQLAFLTSMGRGREDELIRNTLRDVKEIPQLMDAMKEAWRDGDPAALKEVALDPMMVDYPELYLSLVVERNHSWVTRLEEMLETDDIEMVLVGALHLIGDQGVLEQLAARGCTVTQVAAVSAAKPAEEPVIEESVAEDDAVPAPAPAGLQFD